jgi:hypothetical protein
MNKGRNPMTLVSQSTIWEATDGELKILLREIQKELILRNMDKNVVPGWITDLEQVEIDTPMAEAYGG